MDLTTKYLGLSLKHPIVPSASPLSYSLNGIRQLEDAGASAIVMHSLFEEQIKREDQVYDNYINYGSFSFFEALDASPIAGAFSHDPETYVELLRYAKDAVDIPIIASLNGVSHDNWLRYGGYLEEAGADAIELNLYNLVTDPNMTAQQIEENYFNIVRTMHSALSIPLSVKVGPHFTNFAFVAKRFAQTGANSLVLFNRLYQPDFDIDTLGTTPKVFYSKSSDIQLPLQWISTLYGQLSIDFALTSGVHTYIDVLKGIMAGATVTMMASELMQNGTERINIILESVSEWLEANGYDSLEAIRGIMSQQQAQRFTSLERNQYLATLQALPKQYTDIVLDANLIEN